MNPSHKGRLAVFWRLDERAISASENSACAITFHKVDEIGTKLL